MWLFCIFRLFLINFWLYVFLYYTQLRLLSLFVECKQWIIINSLRLLHILLSIFSFVFQIIIEVKLNNFGNTHFLKVVSAYPYKWIMALTIFKVPWLMIENHIKSIPLITINIQLSSTYYSIEIYEFILIQLIFLQIGLCLLHKLLVFINLIWSWNQIVKVFNSNSFRYS